MKFAKYWKKEKLELPDNPFGPPTLAVWGASNESETEAGNNAKNRAQQLLDFFESGFKKNDYEYWNGFIREEVLDEIQSDYGEPLAVITRNHYGAKVLNTECVLFGDIDVPEAGAFSRLLQLFGIKKRDKAFYVEKIKRYQNENTELSFIVYETFAGLRFAITNKTIAPEDSDVERLFKELNVDRLYTRLCKNQLCFRARLTPKPWRIDVPRPPSRYPRTEEEAREFQNWLSIYEAKSRDRLAVKKLATFGNNSFHPQVRLVLEFHDRLACNTVGELA